MQHSPVEKVERIYPLRANTERDLEHIAPATDSGYGSLCHGISAVTEEAKVATSVVAGLTPRISEESPAQVKAAKGGAVENGDTSTLYSDNQSQPGESMTRKYIMEFTEYLFNETCQELDSGEINQLKDSIPDILKEFSVRLGFEVTSQESRDVMYFFHKHRKYVSKFST